jgi:hypothetical protein
MHIVPWEDKKTYEEGVISVAKVTVEYVQNGDAEQPGYSEDAAAQELVVSTENAGGGRFVVIRTDRWAMDRPEEMARILKDFKKRASL